MRGADAKAGVIRRKQGMGLLEGVRSQTAQDLKNSIIGYADAKLDARSTSAGNSGSTDTITGDLVLRAKWVSHHKRNDWWVERVAR